MKRFITGLLCLLPATTWAQVDKTSSAVTQGTPPALSADAGQHRINGRGTCRVVFNASGRAASVAVVASTGSKILDKKTVDFARQHWTGQPNTTALVPIYWQLSPSEKTKIHYRTPVIPYPYSARANRLHGSGSVQVTFDEQGKVISAKMTRSTGNSVLDEATTSFAKTNWTSTGGARSTIEVPIAFP